MRACHLNKFYFRYFLRRRASAATSVYRVITVTDTLSCLNAYPVIGTLLNNRNPGPFSQFYFCQFWGLTWEPLPYYSVFLVLLISLLRTVGLMKPLIRIPKKRVAIVMAVYALFLLVRFLTGAVLFGAYTYDYTSSYSYIHIHNETYQWVDLYLSMILLMLPILPIIISAAITSYYVLRSGLKIKSPQKSNTRSKRHATVTVLIFTCVYIACNIPVTITLVWFSTLVFTGFTNDILKPLNIDLFTTYYIWPTTFVILVQLNAGINPIIYFLRMLEFRSAVGGGGAAYGGKRGLRNVVVKFSDSVRRFSNVSLKIDSRAEGSVDDNNDIVIVNNQFKLTELPEILEPS